MSKDECLRRDQIWLILGQYLEPSETEQTDHKAIKAGELVPWTDEELGQAIADLLS